jgi:hypothetical protein
MQMLHKIRKMKAVWSFIKQLMRHEFNAKDLDIINRRADYLNQEAEDVLAYQVRI